MTGRLSKIKSVHSHVATEIYYTLSLMVFSYINGCYLVEKLAFKIDIHKLTRTEDFDSCNDAIDDLNSLVDVIFELQDSEQKSVSGTEEYILKHLAEDIRNQLKETAQVLG